MAGDVADWGNPNEHTQATRFITDLLTALNLPMQRLLVVPGNHDIDRNEQPAAWTGIRDTPWTIRSDLSDWLANGRAPRV